MGVLASAVKLAAIHAGRRSLQFRAEGVGFRGGLVFKAHRLLYHSTLGLRVIKKKKVQGSGVRV